MQIKDRLKNHIREDVKEKIRESQFTPIVITAVTTAVIMQLFNKKTEVIIINNY